MTEYNEIHDSSEKTEHSYWSFKEAGITTVEEKIAYLGGVSAILPYLPYSLKVIKDYFEKNSNPKYSISEYDLAGISMAKGFVKFHEQRGIKCIGLEETAEIIEYVYQQLLNSPTQELSEYIKSEPKQTDEYDVTLTITGQITVKVQALNEYDAKEAARIQIEDVNQITVECIELKPQACVKDKDGKVTRFK